MMCLVTSDYADAGLLKKENGMRLVIGLSLAFFSLAAFAITPQEIKAQLDANDKAGITNAESYAKTNPNNAEALILLARARVQADMNEKAIAAAEKAVALAPKSSEAYFWLGNAYGSRIGEVGMMSKMSLAPKLRDAFEKTVELDPTNSEARSSLIAFYLQAPSMIGGGKDKAVAQATQIAKYDVARGHLARAQILMHEKKSPEALKAYEAAYAAKPADKNIRMAVGIGYQQAERWPDAFKHFKTWLSQEPNAGFALYQLGKTSALSGLQLDDGIDALKRYLVMPHAKNEPKNENAYHRLGQVYAKAGKKAEAKAAFQAALKLKPDMKEVKEALAKL
jgi:tetratricopeptide (TPR) repeat protein